MEFKEIQTLIKLVSDAGVDEVSIEKPDFKLTIKKNEKQVTYASTPVYQTQAAAAPPPPARGPACGAWCMSARWAWPL